MRVKREMLDNLLHQASFRLNGDSYEQEFGHVVIDRFPNSERFWQLFVVPLTRRIEGYPHTLSANIRPREGVSPELEDIANTNYTTFLNLVYAHLHMQADMLSSLEDFYVHLGSTCDLAETFLEKWFFLLLKCRGDISEVLQKLTRENFLNLAGNWYDKYYPTLYEYYLSKGRALPIRIPSRKNVIKEFFKEYLRNDHLRKRYINHSRAIREFRNVIVHDVQVGRLGINGQIYLPKPQVIQRYRTWRDVFGAANNPEIIGRDFALKSEQMRSDLSTLETILNEIWNLIIEEFIAEFYSPTRQVLRNMYGVILEDD